LLVCMVQLLSLQKTECEKQGRLTENLLYVVAGS